MLRTLKVKWKLYKEKLLLDGSSQWEGNSVSCLGSPEGMLNVQASSIAAGRCTEESIDGQRHCYGQNSTLYEW